MLELHVTDDLLSIISQFIYIYRQSNGITEPVIIAPRIINQERDGTITFVWSDVNKEKVCVSNFGLFEQDTHRCEVIYTYVTSQKVVSCSVNKERTLLGFSILKSKELVERGNKVIDVYEAYLAELQSVEKKVFYLNMERSAFFKVQFLYPEDQAQSQSRDSYMLVFLHKESIGLYRVPMARVGDRGIIVGDQPKTEQIVRKFVWCHWDVQHQRLHYIHNVRVSGDNVTQKMSTIQFYGKVKYENVIDIPINFPFPYIRTADKSHYGDIPLHPGIPDLTLNVTVLTQANGTFCLCYHKLISEPRSMASTQTPIEVQDVEYYVSMVHHAKTLYGCISKLPKVLIVQKRLVFSWLGSYLVVMLPGFFVHLLNVGQGIEPCHHILLHAPVIPPNPFDDSGKYRDASVRLSGGLPAADQSSPPNTESTASNSSLCQTVQQVIPIFSEYCSAMRTLLPCQAFIRESGAMTQMLYDYRSGCLLKLAVNTESMVQSFHTSYYQTQQAILHYLILYLKDFYAIKKLFEELSEDVTNMQMTTMFTEYLVASTYVEMKKQVDKEVLNLLSFTSIETLRGQYEKSPSGERVAHITYLPLEIVDLNNRSSKEKKKRHDEDFWAVLSRRLFRLRYAEYSPRFSHVALMHQFRKAQQEEASGKPVWDPSYVPDSFFDGIFTLKLTDMPGNLGQMQRTDSGRRLETPLGRRMQIGAVLGDTPLFLQAQTSQESHIFKRRLSKITEDFLTQHLLKHLRKESRSKAKNVAKEYLLCQAKVSRQLCHLIWSLGDHQLDQHLHKTLLPNLQEPGTAAEYDLFLLYERFYLTADEMGYPIPPGFSSFFTALGFKCLELHVFFQYVDNHILNLTPDFILQLLNDLSDDSDEEVPYIKFQVISRLPKGFAEQCFERWNHPITQQRKARDQVAQVLLKGTFSSSRESSRGSSRNSAMYGSSFPPLNTFMKHLDSLAASVQSKRPLMYDTGLIEEMALHYTRTKTNFDMSTVNF